MRRSFVKRLVRCFNKAWFFPGGLDELHASARPRARSPYRVRGEDRRRSLIPDSAKEKPQEGEVIAFGEGARGKSGDLISMSVRPGDRILFGKWSGSEIRMDGEKLMIMHESDILGVMA